MPTTRPVPETTRTRTKYARRQRLTPGPGHRKPARFLTLAGLLLPLLFLLGCVTVASTAVVFASAPDRPLHDPGQASTAGQPSAAGQLSATGPEAASIPHFVPVYPGQRAPLSTTLALRPGADYEPRIILAPDATFNNANNNAKMWDNVIASGPPVPPKGEEKSQIPPSGGRGGARDTQTSLSAPSSNPEHEVVSSPTESRADDEVRTAQATPSQDTPTPRPELVDGHTPPPADPPSQPTDGDDPEIEYVVLITIDGLRPDALELAQTPTLDGLRARGAYSPQAQTVNPSFTLPSHVSMLSGVVPQKHGIVEALPCIGCRLSIGPTLFSVAHAAGLTTGMATGKAKLDYLVLPGTIDHLLCADAHDPEVTARAVEFIRAGLPNVLFIHLPDTDRVGHEYGWMSENQLHAVNFADTMIGEIVAELEAGGYLARTLLIITADHGGHGFKHGDDSPVDRTIPWLAVGPGVPQGVILASPINIVDNAATAAYALNLPIPKRWDGRPVLEIFEAEQ